MYLVCQRIVLHVSQQLFMGTIVHNNVTFLLLLHYIYGNTLYMEIQRRAVYKTWWEMVDFIHLVFILLIGFSCTDLVTLLLHSNALAT